MVQYGVIPYFYKVKKLYIIAGPNGAGKTTLSYTILPEIFDCKEFVNADEIAKGISPFSPEKASLLAGRLMLDRIKFLLDKGETFAFETTLSTRSYTNLVHSAQARGYEVILLFLVLESVDLAMHRVDSRVSEGGHNIPKDVIQRRFHAGLKNLFELYLSIVDRWILVDNSKTPFEYIAQGYQGEVFILNNYLWSKLKSLL